jgi:hypothetical protein
VFIPPRQQPSPLHMLGSLDILPLRREDVRKSSGRAVLADWPATLTSIPGSYFHDSLRLYVSSAQRTTAGATATGLQARTPPEVPGAVALLTLRAV